MNIRKTMPVVIIAFGLTQALYAQNVGIGTSNPQFSLHLNSNLVSTGLLMTTTNTGTTTNDGFLIGIRYQQDVPANSYNFLWGNENIPTFFYTHSQLRMQISAAGNVGIGGFFEPNALLHTRGTGTGQGNVLFQGQVKLEGYGEAPASGPGTRLMWFPDKAAFRAGHLTNSNWDMDSIGSFSVAMGFNTKAKGIVSTAFGEGTIALGNQSTAMGMNTEASGFASTAMGYSAKASGRSATATGNFTEASGFYSTAMGFYTEASGYHSTAMGSDTKANAYASTAIGRYNVGGGHTVNWVGGDPLFEIGNGFWLNEEYRANAFTVLKNGRTGINLHNPNAQLHINAPAGTTGLRIDIGGTSKLLASSNGGLSVGGTFNAPPTNGLRIEGESVLQQNLNIGSTAAADATLHIRHTNPPAGIMPDQGLRIQNMSVANRIWTFYTFSSNGALALYSATGGAVSVGNFNAGTGAYTATSNRHLKTNVQLLDADILTRIQQLEPASYSYIRDPLQQRTVGFMAEDVQPIFPELVDTIGENGENLAINYAGFSVVAIKAIQELTEQVEELKKELEEMRKMIK